MCVIDLNYMTLAVKVALNPNTTIFPFHIAIAETTDSDERGMNPVAVNIISPRKEYWPSRDLTSDLLLKSCTLLTGPDLKESKICCSIKWFKPLPNDKFQTSPNWKSLQTTILNVMKIEESFSNG